jgi:DNA-binding CsgD family transcriptional regulator
MNSSSAIYFYCVIAIALWSVIWAGRSSRLYRIQFLKDYFFFILAFTGYGFLHFTGQVFLANVFSDSDYYRSLSDLVVFTLAIPLLVIWLYYYLLFMTRLCLINVPRKSKIGYWIINAMLILGNFIAIQVLMETKDPSATHSILMWKEQVYLGLFCGTNIIPFVFSKRIPNRQGKTFARIISAMYLAGFACLVIFGDVLHLAFYSDRFLFLAFLSLIYFFINVPPLIYMSVFLKRYSSQLSISQEIEDDSLEAFASQFRLTKREREVMGFIVQGMSNEEIAEVLFIAVQTVKNNVSAIYRKTGVKNRVQLGNILRNYEEREV